MYHPLNIKRQDEFTNIFSNLNHLYTGFGKAEYEWIIQRLLNKSQQERKWISLDANSFVDLFYNDEEEAKSYLEKMAQETKLLTKKRGKFRLTSLTINILAKNYPRS